MNKMVKVFIIFIAFLLIFIVEVFSKYIYTKKITAYELNIKLQDEKMNNNQNIYNYKIPEYNDDKIDIIQIIR